MWYLRDHRQRTRAKRASRGRLARVRGHTPHRPWVDAVKIRCKNCGAEVSRIKDVGNPWLDAGIVPYSTLHYRTEPEYWRGRVPAALLTQAFSGHVKNKLFSLLGISGRVA